MSRRAAHPTHQDTSAHDGQLQGYQRATPVGTARLADPGRNRRRRHSRRHPRDNAADDQLRNGESGGLQNRPDDTDPLRCDDHSSSANSAADLNRHQTAEKATDIIDADDEADDGGRGITELREEILVVDDAGHDTVVISK